MATLLDGEVYMPSYANRLKALQRDRNLFNHLKFFVRDLHKCNQDVDAKFRLLRGSSAKFYMSSIYFTPKQVEILISFKGRSGRTLEDVRRLAIAWVGDNIMSQTDINSFDYLGRVLRDMFGLKRYFYCEHDFQHLFNKFLTKRLD